MSHPHPSSQRRLEQQLRRLSRREQQALAPPPPSLLEQKTRPLVEKFTQCLPPKAEEGVRAAFSKGFVLVLERGSGLIQRVCDPHGRQALQQEVSHRLESGFSRRQLSRLDRRALWGGMLNTTLSTAEGAVLGVLGIGLPDIPVCIAITLKTLFEAALSYGFDPQQPEERRYLLLLLPASLSQGDSQSQALSMADRLADCLDRGLPIPPQLPSLEQAARLAGDALCDALAQSKLVQGIPVVGVAGALANRQVLSRVGRLARIKYKQRFLRRLHPGQLK